LRSIRGSSEVGALGKIARGFRIHCKALWTIAL
jgi:hypothetical protein